MRPRGGTIHYRLPVTHPPYDVIGKSGENLNNLGLGVVNGRGGTYCTSIRHGPGRRKKRKTP